MSEFWQPPAREARDLIEQRFQETYELESADMAGEKQYVRRIVRDARPGQWCQAELADFFAIDAHKTPYRYTCLILQESFAQEDIQTVLTLEEDGHLYKIVTIEPRYFTPLQSLGLISKTLQAGADEQAMGLDQATPADWEQFLYNLRTEGWS